MKAHLDLHLIELIEENHINDAINCARDGNMHYKRKLKSLLMKEILEKLKKNLVWHSFVHSIKLAIISGALSAMSSSSLSTFLRTLKERFFDLKLELGKNISLVDEDVYLKYRKCIDFQQVCNKLCKELQSIQLNSSLSSKEKVVSLIKERMIASESQNARPQCEVQCPHCNLTCFLSTRHNDHHNTLHQLSRL